MSAKELDSDVINLLRDNGKIAAIKLLREKEGIGLKEAKQAVDEHMTRHPELHSSRTTNTKRSSGSLLFLVAIACLLYLGYDLFLAT